jgi:hypothetical protein
MPVRATGGLSKFAIDNSRGGSDVYAKLCRPSPGTCAGLRHVFVPVGGTFTMTDVAPGTYELRYRDLSSGALAKSAPLSLQQFEDGTGTRFSAVRLTLYRVSGGNTEFSPVSEDNF